MGCEGKKKGVQPKLHAFCRAGDPRLEEDLRAEEEAGESDILAVKYPV